LQEEGMNTTFTQSAHKGDNVICLHSSMSSSRQWQDLVRSLQPAYNVITPDLLGYGNAPQWAAAVAASLEHEVERLTDLVDELDGPIHLVGHSYGGAIAIRAAQVYGERVTSLTLYEPVIFTALFNSESCAHACREMTRLVEEIRIDYHSGNLFLAAKRFIDYWSGKGVWETMPVPKQFQLSAQVPTVLANFEALTAEANAFNRLACLKVPTLYLSGQESPATVQAITTLLKLEMPHAIQHCLSGMGHMGPITHGDIVNTHIERFITCRSAEQYNRDYAWAA
jgi:pimeloyl-ACP methyl ester carboxylesterase